METIDGLSSETIVPVDYRQYQETRSVPIFIHFLRFRPRIVKGLPKTKRCNSVAVTVSVWVGWVWVYKNQIAGWPHTSCINFDWLI